MKTKTPQKNIPDGWLRNKLGDVARFSNGKGHEQYIVEGGEYVVVNSKFISSDGNVKKYSNEFLAPLKSGQVTMVMSDVPNGRAIAKCFLIAENNKYSLNQRIGAFESREIIPAFLVRLLNRNRYFLSYDDGVNQTNLRKEDILSCPLIYPPLPEQKRIVVVLEAWDSYLEKLAKKIKLKKRIKKGLMQQLLTGKKRLKDFTKPWKEVSLWDFADKNQRWSFTGGPFGSNLKQSDYVPEGIRIVQLQNIGDGVFLNEYCIYTSKQKADELLSCNIYPGDIILSKMGDPVARACIIPNTDTRYLMASDGIRLSVNEKKFNKMFVFYSINSKQFRTKVESASTGSTRKRIGLSVLKKLTSNTPDLAEQTSIADILIKADDEIEALEKKKAIIEAQRKYLLNNLIAGAIRTPEDLLEKANGRN